jgi:predicted RNA methylase
LYERVSPGGRVLGLDGDPAHVAMASELVASRALTDVEIVSADARRTGCRRIHSTWFMPGHCW